MVGPFTPVIGRLTRGSPSFAKHTRPANPFGKVVKGSETFRTKPLSEGDEFAEGMIKFQKLLSSYRGGAEHR
jgi:hypothetical protein